MGKLLDEFDNNNIRLRSMLSKAVIDYRYDKNITQEKFSKLSGVTRVFIGQLETDYRIDRQIRRDSIEKIEFLTDYESEEGKKFTEDINSLHYKRENKEYKKTRVDNFSKDKKIQKKKELVGQRLEAQLNKYIEDSKAQLNKDRKDKKTQIKKRKEDEKNKNELISIFLKAEKIRTEEFLKTEKLRISDFLKNDTTKLVAIEFLKEERFIVSNFLKENRLMISNFLRGNDKKIVKNNKTKIIESVENPELLSEYIFDIKIGEEINIRRVAGITKLTTKKSRHMMEIILEKGLVGVFIKDGSNVFLKKDNITPDEIYDSSILVKDLYGC